MKAFSVNLQGNFETNTQLGLRNHLKDDELKARLPIIFKEIYTQLRELIENACQRWDVTRKFF